MAAQDLKKLPPEERIRKLKQLEQERKKEIEEAQQQIRESESEIKEKKRWIEKVPIPEVAKEELEGLSEEGKQLLKTHKGTKESKKEAVEVEEPAGKKPSRPISKLEETLLQERPTIPAETLPQMEYGAGTKAGIRAGGEYKPLSQQPTADIYREMGSMRQAIEEKGYVSKADERKAEYMSGIIEERLQASKEGAYSFSEETARAASITQSIAYSIRQAYKKGSSFEHDWYKGR